MVLCWRPRFGASLIYISVRALRCSSCLLALRRPSRLHFRPSQVQRDATAEYASCMSQQMQPNIASLPLAWQGAAPRALSASLALTDCPTQHLDLFLSRFKWIRATSRHRPTPTSPPFIRLVFASEHQCRGSNARTDARNAKHENPSYSGSALR